MTIRKRISGPALLFSFMVAGLGGPATAEPLGRSSDTLDALVEAREIPVRLNNFVRAATDIELDKYATLAGGVNRFYHFREPTPVDNQPTIRMNRDTLYSAAVIDISAGAALTLPEAGDRYMSAMVINQDHYINSVFHGGGTYRLDMETFDTPYVIVFMRTLVDADDPEDIAAVNALQDRMTIEAASAKPFILPDYDEESFEGIVKAALELERYAAGSRGAAGSKEEVNDMLHFILTAAGWGALPEKEAFYLGVTPRLPVGEYKIEVPAKVPVGAFWSVSLYNVDGYFVPNDRDAYVVNSVMGERNEDGSMTVHFGGCDDGRVNCLPIMEGWNYTIRFYQPSEQITDGSWKFPDIEPAN